MGRGCGHLLSWLTSLERTTGVIVTSHSAAVLGPALCQQSAKQGELPKGTCQLQIITCSQNKPFQCDVMAWLQNALVAVLRSLAGLCSSWQSRAQPGTPGSEIRAQWHPWSWLGWSWLPQPDRAAVVRIHLLLRSCGSSVPVSQRDLSSAKALPS